MLINLSNDDDDEDDDDNDDDDDEISNIDYWLYLC